MDADDIGGVHIKYLHHCRRQLWLYARGLRPEARSDLVADGEAVHDTTLDRHRPVDLGAARLDHLDGDGYVHETKSSRRHSPADAAQAIHYCHRLAALGVDVHGAVLHYPATRRTVRITYDDSTKAQAETDVAAALDVVGADVAPERLDRPACKGCSFFDYCWSQ